ncbi:hypothetical protein [Streptomyces sp. KR55]|uniref:hypothetical protein n=1 Tax=Streptomyces sp. KR55 TaxID=3457425 RepID=UPI003FCF2B40
MRSGVRLPFPRRAGLLVPWRDTTALLRAPGRLLWAVVWAAVAVALVGLDDVPAPVTLMALPAGYLAAAQLAEPARLEADDLRRSAQLPWTAAGLALRHGLVPAAGLLALFVLGPAVAGAAGLWSDRLLVLPALAPALVGAALVSAYRGTVPVHLMTGSMTPLGGHGAVRRAAVAGAGAAGGAGCAGRGGRSAARGGTGRRRTAVAAARRGRDGLVGGGDRAQDRAWWVSTRGWVRRGRPPG